MKSETTAGSNNRPAGSAGILAANATGAALRYNAPGLAKSSFFGHDPVSGTRMELLISRDLVVGASPRLSLRHHAMRRTEV